VLNLFIGVIVGAMQEEHEKVAKAELEAERDIIEEETAPVLRELKEMKAELAALRQAVQQR
jgi:voltage-gated sodium channel